MEKGAKVWFGIAAFLVFAVGCCWVDGNPIFGVCIRNCAQCKKMFGPYFEGQLCADTCVKYKAKIIPDCEDIASIAPFLNRFD
ncbi:unnamed protein product [Phaedon cochleariae]|uniref:Eclosion hormone n=1 Tax=Phaedon cochleariae TaxID=80249 RepID=A0A9P0DNW7_PHACE|nr:unnamed protein product [Phaedon cochleariae]